MIDFSNVRSYLPVGRIKNKILFAFVKEDMLMGQKLSDKKNICAVNVIILTPSQISYKKSFIRLAHPKFVSLLEPLGYTKEKNVFIMEPVTKMPEKFDQVLNGKLYKEMNGKPLTVLT